MSVRGQPSPDPADACPFVAFEDERDERSTRPDHRHRCYAELRPAPRALAHQEAYCLSPAFATCPTFRDWARREAARARPPVRAPEARIEDVPPYDAGYGRRQSDWTAPPPWTLGDGDRADVAPGIAAPAAAAGAAAGTTPAGGPPGGGPGSPSAGPSSRPPQPVPPGSSTDAPGFLTSRDRGQGGATEGAGLAASAALAAAGPPPPGFDDELEAAGAGPPSRSAAGGTASRAYAPDSAGEPRGREGGGGTDAGRAVRGPSWERPRRYEAYPTLRTRVGLPAVPRIAFGFVALLVAAVALFLLPTLVLRPGGGGDGGAGDATASPSTSAEASASLSPTPVPSPTAQIYVVVAGDTLSGIAKKKGVTIAELQAANPQIKNIDQLQIGDRLTIPAPAPSDVLDAGSPSASPSG